MKAPVKMGPMVAALILGACQTITINGVEVTQQEQAGFVVFAIVAGAIVAQYSEDGEPPSNDQFNPGDVICKVNLETGECQ